MKKNSRRTALIASLVVIVVCLIGGTIAWLTDTTTAITNTFTIGNVDIDLTEQNPEGQTAKMVPGSTITKDPKITVDKSSEECYVYVKITDNASNYISWEIAEGWTALTGQTGVYWRVYSPADPAVDTDYNILKNNTVTVEDNIAEITSGDSPSLTFQAYAIQKANITDAADGWAKLNP